MKNQTCGLPVVPVTITKLIISDPQTGQKVNLFNPRTQKWDEHFEWIEDGLKLNGLTATGRATIVALRMNTNPFVLEAREQWIAVGWHPPD